MALGKLKLLYLMRILERETDDEHGLSLNEIAARLERHGVRADRKTLYQDLDDLRAYGLDVIIQREGRETKYHLGARAFELPELKLLVDSVQAAKFITDRKSRELIGKLEGLASVYQAKELHRQVYIAGRVKTMNETIYYNIDRLHEAINSDRKIRFQYYQWTVDKAMALRRGGDFYIVSPWALCWEDENYYLVAFDGSDGSIRHYRVDKMLNISLCGERREGRERFMSFDMVSYSKALFGMFGGETAHVTIEGEARLCGVIIDRFGQDVTLITRPDGRFEAHVDVALSPQFFGWIMALGEGIKITAPEDVVSRMKSMVKALGAIYAD